MSENHPSSRLDETIHQRVRLGLLALLQDADRVTFKDLHDAIGGNEGTLSRHLSVLEEAGYVRIDKGYEGKRPRTWASITDPGRVALDHHVKTLRELMSRVEARTNDPVVAAVLAMAALPEDGEGDSVEQRVTPIGLAHVVLDEAPQGFGIVADAPINRFYEWPYYPGTRNTFGGGYEKSQRDFLKLGLRAGYWRNWVREGPSRTGISIQVLELRDEEATRRYVTTAQHTGLRPMAGLDPDVAAFAQDIGDGVTNACTWFAAGKLLGSVIVWGAHDVVEPLVRELVPRQRERMVDAVIEPA